MPSVPARTVGRYRLYEAIARGGMATVHLGRLVGPVGFARTVAVKCLHAQLADDPEFVAMFLDEARLAARIRHPNVVSTLDVVSNEGELFLVMDYVQGESLAALLRAAKRAGERPPPPIVSAIVCQALLGLHAAHEATNDLGAPLSIVHRDVSPQNVLVGADGVARVADFGVAWAAHRAHSTQNRGVKGKVQYMAPEQLFETTIDRRADVFSSAVVLWESLTCQRLFTGELGAIVGKHASGDLAPPSSFVPSLPPQIDAVVMRGLSRDPEARFPTARAMAEALEAALPPAGSLVVGDWVERLAAQSLAEKRALLATVEADVAAAVEDPIDARTGVSGALLPVEQAVPEDGSSRARGRVFFGVGVVAVALAVVATWRFGPGREAESGVPAGETRLAPESARTVSPAPPPTVEPSPASASASAPSVTPRDASARPVARMRPSGRPAAPPGCVPPYVVRADGSKQFKPECF